MGQNTDTQLTASDAAGAGDERKSGRAVFTDDGRSIWEWQTATGVFTQNISAEQLSHLEAADLRVVDSHPATTHGSWTSMPERAAAAAIVRKQYAAIKPAAKVAPRSGFQALLRMFTGTH